MTHRDALEGNAVERYLLGEFQGDARDRFEDHLFDCAECAADLKSGVLFLEAARSELAALPSPARAAATSSHANPFAWLWQPWVLAPALAACLAIIVFQSAVVLPRLHTELADAQAPAVLQPLVLANAGARGGSLPSITVPAHRPYLLSVDIPPAPTAAAFRCTLVSPAGDTLWHLDVPAAQASDAVTLEVPTASAREGTNELRIEVLPAQPASGDKLVLLARYRYTVSFAGGGK